MLTFAGTQVMQLMLRRGWGWGWVGHVNVRWHLRSRGEENQDTLVIFYFYLLVSL